MTIIHTFFTGKLVESIDSTYNGKIEVYKRWNRYKIVAGGLLQSGSIIKQLWQKPLSKIPFWQRGQVSRSSFQADIGISRGFKNKPNVLILGLGGGTVATLIHKKWPQAHITGIEIDPAMISISKKYFHLNQQPNLDIIQAEAFVWVETRFIASQHNPPQFDLILVDLFCGDQTNNKLSSTKFLSNLKKIATPHATIIFNRLFYDEHIQEAEKFVKTVEKQFDNVKLIRNLSNLFVTTKVN